MTNDERLALIKHEVELLDSNLSVSLATDDQAGHIDYLLKMLNSIRTRDIVNSAIEKNTYASIGAKWGLSFPGAYTIVENSGFKGITKNRNAERNADICDPNVSAADMAKKYNITVVRVHRIRSAAGVVTTARQRSRNRTLDIISNPDVRNVDMAKKHDVSESYVCNIRRLAKKLSKGLQ